MEFNEFVKHVETEGLPLREAAYRATGYTIVPAEAGFLLRGEPAVERYFVWLRTIALVIARIDASEA